VGVTDKQGTLETEKEKGERAVGEEKWDRETEDMLLNRESLGHRRPSGGPGAGEFFPSPSSDWAFCIFSFCRQRETEKGGLSLRRFLPAKSEESMRPTGGIQCQTNCPCLPWRRPARDGFDAFVSAGGAPCPPATYRFLRGLQPRELS